MSKEEILEEMVKIYQKYFKVVEELGTLSMSPQDKERLEELEKELKKESEPLISSLGDLGIQPLGK